MQISNGMMRSIDNPFSSVSFRPNIHQIFFWREQFIHYGKTCDQICLTFQSMYFAPGPTATFIVNELFPTQEINPLINDPFFDYSAQVIRNDDIRDVSVIVYLMQKMHLVRVRLLWDNYIDVNLFCNRFPRIQKEIIVSFFLAILHQYVLCTRISQTGRNAQDRRKARMVQHGFIQRFGFPLREFLN